MKKFEVKIYGYGVEIAIGTLTNEENALIKTIKRKKRVSLEDLYSEYPDELEENNLQEWYDVDDIYHETGAITKNTFLSVVDLQNNITLCDKKIDLITDLNTTVEEQKFVLKDCPVMVSVSYDEGDFLRGTIEIEDNEDFDISKLEIIKEKILATINTTGWFSAVIIKYILYNGKDLVDENRGDADRKNFSVEIHTPRKKYVRKQK